MKPMVLQRELERSANTAKHAGSVTDHEVEVNDRNNLKQTKATETMRLH